MQRDSEPMSAGARLGLSGHRRCRLVLSSLLTIESDPITVRADDCVTRRSIDGESEKSEQQAERVGLRAAGAAAIEAQAHHHARPAAEEDGR